MAKNFRKKDAITRDIKYLNKDFTSFRKDLTEYAGIHFSDKIQDFSESGLGGLFIDMSAYVGDVMSYYLDHQFNELNLETAIEPINVERLIRSTGVKITGASPSYTDITFFISVPSKISNGQYVCDDLYLPVIKAGTILQSNSGVEFTLVEDVNMAEKDGLGKLLASKQVDSVDNNSNPLTYIVYRTGIVTSSKFHEEVFSIGSEFQAFREIELSNPDVSEITSVIDREKNEYYEVESLSEDTTFLRYNNIEDDKEIVVDSLKIVPAPRRFETFTSPRTGKTVIRFGSGRSETYENDTIPNPSDHALPLFGERKSFTRLPINPNKFLESSTLGVAPQSTEITIRYRAGGGLSHNVPSGEITNIRILLTEFNESGVVSNIRLARSSIEAFNESRASGGTDRPSLEDYRFSAIASRGNQGRVVTKQDLLARVYTMPAKFGRVFRAGIVRNIGSINSVSLSVISQDRDGFLTTSSDTLKKNMAKYLNEFRLLSDSYDIIDAFIANFAIRVDVKVDKRFNKEAVKSNVIINLTEYFQIENFQIDQPISISEVVSLIYNIDGVTEIVNISLIERSGIFNGLSYSLFSYSIQERRRDNEYFPPIGGMFELKYPDSDILVATR